MCASEDICKGIWTCHPRRGYAFWNESLLSVSRSQRCSGTPPRCARGSLLVLSLSPVMWWRQDWIFHCIQLLCPVSEACCEMFLYGSGFIVSPCLARRHSTSLRQQRWTQYLHTAIPSESAVSKFPEWEPINMDMVQHSGPP